MEIEELEKIHGDFYVPAFAIKVGGKDVVRNHLLAVSSVSVDRKERASGRFSFTIVDSFDPELRQFMVGDGDEAVDLFDMFAFGSSVQVYLGYGDPTNLPLMLKGIVTELSTNFSSGGAPELTVSGFDDLYPMTIGSYSRNWEDDHDSVAVSDLVGGRGFAVKVEKTDVKRQRLDQRQQTDMAFLEKLAKDNKATFYLQPGPPAEFFFGERHNNEEAVTLEWGFGLVSFSPEVNIEAQVSEVQVHAQLAKEGEAVVGKATKGDESRRASKGQSGAELVGKALSKNSVLNVHAPVHTKEEADDRAKAILDERAQEFVTGSGECIGLPEIVPGVNIGIRGVAKRFEGKYWVLGVEHSIDGSGYTTSFDVRAATV